VNAQNDGIARPQNDDCSAAIQLPVDETRTFYDFTLEGAAQSEFHLPSAICSQDNDDKDVWFTAKMPINGKLDIFIEFPGEAATVIVYTGNCEGMKYLACNGIEVEPGTPSISLRDPKLGKQEVCIRVLNDAEMDDNDFSIQLMPIETKPVAVSELSADYSGQQIEVSWTTNGEEELSHISVQHSPDNLNFTNISSLEGRNNSSTEQYTITHTSPQMGANHYRLILVDKVGVATILESVSIEVGQYNALTRMYPNPTSERVFLQFPKEIMKDTPALLELIDVTGRPVASETFLVSPSEEIAFEIKNRGIAPGNYFLRGTQQGTMILNQQLRVAY